MKHTLTLALALFALALSAYSQKNIPIYAPVDSSKTYQVELVDGTEFLGTILSKDSNRLVLSTSSIPRIELNLETIRKIREIENKLTINGTTALPNPHYTRYLFAPSAFNLKKGEGYYQNTYLVLNSINYGFTDHFSMGVSIEVMSTFGSIGRDWNPIYLLTPKYGFQLTKNLNMALGALIAGAGNEGGFQLGYGILTYGNTENNLSLGVSAGLTDGIWMEQPPVTLSGMCRLGKKTSLITENWIVPDLGSLFSYGVRFFGDRLAVDLGFVNNKDIMDIMILGVPYVDFTVKF
jgi:hypothetical protein